MDHYEDDFDDVLDLARALLGGTEDEMTEANDLASAALRMRPHDHDAWLLKCQVLSALGDDTAALAAVEMALRYKAHSSESHYWRAAVLSDLSRPQDALRAIDRAFRHLDRDDDWLLEDLFCEKAMILEAAGDRDDAVRTYEAGLSRCPDSPLLKAGVEPLRRASMRARLKVLRGGLC